MQTRTVGSIIAAGLLVLAQAGCRNLPRGGLGRGPDVRTIAGVGVRPERLATRDQGPSTISSRVDPPAGADRADRIVGRVVDDRGVPVANARVRLAVDGTAGGREVSGTTNRSGEFLLKGLRPGESYTVIAEWDDGREQLLGRSSVSAPADEVRIRVASVAGGGFDRAEVTSGLRPDSAGVALFGPADREPGPAPDPEGRPGSSRVDPPPRAEAPGQGRGRSGWMPADAVRRASMEPSDAESWPDDRFEDAPGPDPIGPDPERSVARPPDSGPPASGASGDGRGLGRGRPEDSDLWGLEPEELPLPMTGVVDAGRAEAPPRSAAPVRPIARGPEPAAPRPVDDGAAPPVRRFEPEAARERDLTDPPLLMTDVPPEIEERDEPADPPPIDDPRTRPGAMQLAPAPDPSPEPEPEPGPGPEPRSMLEPENPAAEDPNPFAGVPEAPGPEPDAEVEPMPFDPLPEPSANLESDFPTISSLPDLPSEEARPPGPLDEKEDRRPGLAAVEPGRLDEPGPPVAIARDPEQARAAPAGPEPSPETRWAELPPPARLDPRGPAGEEAATAPGGLGRWSQGLLKLVRRDREEAPKDPGVAPAVRFDEGRHRLDDFTLPDLNGKPFRLREAESDYVLLCFWGTWCDPCLAAMPHLADLQGQFGKDRLRVVAIAYERNGEGGPRSVGRAARRLGMNYPVLLAPADGSCPVAGALEVQYFPTLVLLDREGRVVHRETGATGDKLMRLDRAIAAAMDESILTVTRR